MRPRSQVRIVHRFRPTYINTPEQTFARYHTVQEYGMETLAVVITSRIQAWRNYEYV